MGACLACLAGHSAKPAHGHLVARRVSFLVQPEEPANLLGEEDPAGSAARVAPDHPAAPGDPRGPWEEPCPCCYYRISSCDAAGRYTTG